MSIQELFKAVQNDNQQKVLEILQFPDLNLNVVEEKQGKTLLHFAIENKNMHVLESLLEYGKNQIDPNLVDNDEVTPLLHAIKYNFVEGVFTLVKSPKLNINHKFEGGRTVLHYAADQSSLPQIVLALITNGIDINALCQEDGTALHVAVKEMNIEAALLLLEQPNINLQNIDGNWDSILHLAVRVGAGEIVQEIFKLFTKMISLEQQEIVNLIINMKNKQGNTIYHEAEIRQRVSISKLIQDQGKQFGLNLEAKNIKGMTAEQIKQQKDNAEKQQKEEQQLKKREQQQKKQEKYIQKRQDQKLQAEEDKLEAEEEKQKQEKSKALMQNLQKKGPYYLLFILIFLFVGLYLIFKYIPKKSNNLEDMYAE